MLLLLLVQAKINLFDQSVDNLLFNTPNTITIEKCVTPALSSWRTKLSGLLTREVRARVKVWYSLEPILGPEKNRSMPLFDKVLCNFLNSPEKSMTLSYLTHQFCISPCF